MDMNRDSFTAQPSNSSGPQTSRTKNASARKTNAKLSRLRKTQRASEDFLSDWNTGPRSDTRMSPLNISIKQNSHLKHRQFLFFGSSLDLWTRGIEQKDVECDSFTCAPALDHFSSSKGYNSTFARAAGALTHLVVLHICSKGVCEEVRGLVFMLL